MIKILITLIFVSLLMVCSGCKNDNTIIEGTLNKEFTIKKGQEFHSKQDKLTVKFIDVLEDNRCTGTCVWEGYAIVAFQVTDNDKTDSLTLNTTNQRGYLTTKDFGQYKIKLVQLNSGGTLSDHNATLLVTK